MKPIAHIHTDFTTKFGVPRQAGLVKELRAAIVFEPEYRNAEALRGRALELERRLREYDWDAPARVLLEDRIRLLRTMWREARDLAVLCERYYDRGYRRNVKYTV